MGLFDFKNRFFFSRRISPSWDYSFLKVLHGVAMTANKLSLLWEVKVEAHGGDGMGGNISVDIIDASMTPS